MYVKRLKNFPILIALALVVNAVPTPPLQINSGLHGPFRFVAYGDTRFTDPANTGAANPEIRQRLVRAIAEAKPDFITFGGDISYNGENTADWKVFDSETAIWRERGIPVYPALGNHDLHGNLAIALDNYFARFPNLQRNRFYSVRAANSLMLTLDSALDELVGPQGDWVHNQLDHVPPDVDFVFIILHHPPITSSTEFGALGGGHSARSTEFNFGVYLEEQQKRLRARIVVFAGHVHNYEHHIHGGINYFVTGGGGAHPYLISRKPGDLFQGQDINYHFLLVEVQADKLKVTMNRLEMQGGVPNWTQPDSVTILGPDSAAALK